MRRGGITVLVLLAACGPGVVPTMDGGVDAGRDASHDVFVAPHDVAIVQDTMPAMVPARSWVLTALGARGGNVVITLRVDAHGASGPVRLVAGGDGRGSSLVLQGPSERLVGTTPLSFAYEPDLAGCEISRCTLDLPVLVFADHDGDGVAEALQSVASIGQFHETTLAGDTTAFETSSFVSMVPQLDAMAPTFTVGEGNPVFTPGLPLVLRASEPIDPSFRPSLTGAATQPLVPEPGVTSASRWTLDTWDLPAGHYEITFEGAARDLAGLDPAMPPAFAFDSLGAVVHDVTQVDPLVVGFQSATPITFLPADGTYTDSVLSASRLVIAANLDVGSYSMRVRARILSQEATDFPFPSITIYGPDGTQSTVSGASAAPETSTVPGYVSECPFLATIPLTARASGRWYFVIDPGGADARCTGQRVTPDQGIALELFALD